MAKRKDAPTSFLTRSGNETSAGKQASTNPLNTLKSPKFNKNTGPTPSTAKKKPETSEKQMGSTRLRRSERGKNLEEPRMSPAVPLNPQEQKRENHGSSNGEALQTSGRSLEEDIARKERNEIDKFHSEWFEKKMTIMNDFRLEKILIRSLYTSNSSVRSDKLNLVEKEFADKLNAHERLKHVYFNELKAMRKAAVGQVVVNDGSSLNGPVHEIQIVDLTESEKEDQESREVAPALLGNSTEAESHDIPIGDISGKQHAGIDMAPNVYSADVSQAVEDANKNGTNNISLEYADGSHAVADLNGTSPNYVAPNVESVELGYPAGNCNQEKAQDTTPSIQQVAFPVSDHSMPAIPEIHNDSHLLQQLSENGIQDQDGQADPIPIVEIEDDNMQPVEAIQVDQIIPEDSSPVMSANPTITENQAAMLPTSEVLAQTTAAQTHIQGNANFNKVGSQMRRRVDPLHIELEHLSSLNKKMVKSYHHNIQQINIDCEKELAEAIAEIRLKYCNKRQEAIATFNSQNKEIENNMKTVVINQVLAASYRQKFQDVSRGSGALQQVFQAEAMQQRHRFCGPSTCLPGQFSGTQQPPPIQATAVVAPPQQTQPTRQIVHQPSALFLTPLNRHPHTTNLRPANSTPIRPPPNTQTCDQSPESRPLVRSVTRSPASHMGVLVSPEIRTPDPGCDHRPSVASVPRPHL